MVIDDDHKEKDDDLPVDLVTVPTTRGDVSIVTFDFFHAMVGMELHLAHMSYH